MARGLPAFVVRLAGFVLFPVLLVSVALCTANASAFAAQLGPLSAAKPASSASAGAAAPAPEEKVAPDSPRAAIDEFTTLTRNGDYVKAARYLDLSAVDASDGPVLAKRLRDVLDRHLWVDPSKLSPDPHGADDDGLAPDRDELGSVPGPAGKPEQVVIVRRVDRSGARWLFSSATVARIDPWYEHLENRWLLDHLPKWSLRFGPHELRWWQWLALPPLLLCGLLVAFVITRLSRILIRRVLAENSAEFLRRMRGPAMLAWTIITSYALLPWLGLYEPADAFVRRGFSASLLVALFWALWKAVELSQHSVSSAHWARNSLTAASLLSLGARLGKFVVAAFAFVAVLAELGYPVTSIITGLGIGGIALALAAQKTVENLFGAFSLAIDQPFREGDVIQVDSISGTVESIGLRSTRIRTVDRTLITIPNGKLAEMRVETITARDRLRFYCVLGVAHSPAKQITAILQGVERILRDHPLVANDSISVRLIALTDSAMNLEIVAMVETSDYARFLEVRQSLLLGIVEVVDKSGSSLAHPVSSIRLTEADQAQLTPPPPPPASGPRTS
ncbi:MAG: mechanosensitive ion channel family protein [Myxococcales bacterium]